MKGGETFFFDECSLLIGSKQSGCAQQKAPPMEKQKLKYFLCPLLL